MKRRRYRLLPGAVAVSLLYLTTAGRAQTGAPRDERLAFAGFPAGAELDEIRSILRGHAGRRLGCTRSRADSTVQECRSSYRDSASGRSVEVWLSAIEGKAGILTLKTDGSPSPLERWRADLTTRYGRVEARVQGPQRMLQWVRKGRMIRLTWRVDSAAPVVSVSLVDGHILDGWGRKRE